MKKTAIGIVFLLFIVALGSYYQLHAVPYIVIVAVVAVTVLIALNKINERYYPVYIYGLALALLWQTSMLGSHIVGADIHGEFFVANKAITEGWNWSFAHVNNTSVVIGGLTPLLAKLGISPVWQFKALYPAVFAAVPVILYIAYSRMFGTKRAYFASLFFMIVPVFFVEIVGIVKSMVAEVFLALMVLLMVINIKSWLRILGLGVAVTLAALCHYTIGILAAMYLVGCFVVLLVGKKWLRTRMTVLASYGLAIIIVFTSVYFWYSSSGDGFMFKYLNDVGHNVTAAAIYFLPKSTILEPTITEPIILEPIILEPEDSNTKPSWLRQEPLVRAAVGLDFADVEPEGKAFRILQYLTQFLIVTGFYYLIRRNMFTSEFITGVIVSFGLLGMVLFFPTFSSIVNASRFYHVSLFFLAPLLIIGTEGIVNDLERLRCLREHR